MRFHFRKNREVERLEEDRRIHNEQYADLQKGYDQMREARNHFRKEAERLEGYGLDHELENKGDLVRPSVKLISRSPDAAPIVLVFTAFPGLHVRLGRWRTEAFPTCGCDACDETADGEAARLSGMVDDVTAGRFREAIGLPLLGRAWQESEFWSPKGRASGRWRIDRSRARQMLRASDRSSFEWKPWPRREKAVGSDAV